MTEADWLASTHPHPMLQFLRGRADARKLRLFACACCRRIWGSLGDGRSRMAVEAAERFADGLADLDALQEAQTAAFAAAQEIIQTRRTRDVTDPDIMYGIHDDCLGAPAACAAAYTAMLALDWVASAAHYASQVMAQAAGPFGVAWIPDSFDRHQKAEQDEWGSQAALLRDIFGNPFRPPPPLAPGWLTGGDDAISRTARSIYEGRTFGALPALGDALEEGGCTAPEILSHCRHPGEHVRGCWVVDAILGRADAIDPIWNAQ